jgi:NADPH:quinone reductase-like Zn-dependent oxidoreductase
MKAVVYETYGGPDVLHLTERPMPVPKRGEVLVRVRAASVSSGDVRMRAFDVPAPFRIPARFMLGWPRPRMQILGHEFAGEVEMTGPDVTRFKVGDRVYGSASSCYAQYCTVAETGAIAHIPINLGFEDAVALPFGMTTAMYFLGKGKLSAGHSLLVIGASGCVGVYTTQLARHLGMTVTAVCSGQNAELVRRAGASNVLDYTSEDYLASGPYDAVMDAVGIIDFPKSRGLLKPGGVFLNVVMGTTDLLAVLSPFKGGRRIVSGSFEPTQEMLVAINELVGAGVIMPVLDRTYALDQIRDAHAYVDTKRKRGAVVVTV